MNKFTNNAYEFINSCVGNSPKWKISFLGDINKSDVPIGNCYFYVELKNMIITDIELQPNEICLVVKKIDNHTNYVGG